MDAQLCFLYFCGFNTKSILRYTPSIIFFKKLFDMWEYAEMKIHGVPNEDKKLHKMIIKLIQTNKRIYKRWNLLLENYFILILNSPYTTVCKLKDTHLKNGYYAVCYTPPFFWPFKKKKIIRKWIFRQFSVLRLKNVFLVRDWPPTNRQIIQYFNFFFIENQGDSLYYTLYILNSSIESGR